MESKKQIADTCGSDSSSASPSSSIDYSQDDERFERKDTITYSVNLIETSYRLLSCYTSQLQFSSPGSFLCSSTDSLRCIFSVSLLLKELLKKVVSSGKVDGSSVRVNGLTLGALLPSPARQKQGLRRKCVHMFQAIFISRSDGRNNSVRLDEKDVQNAGVDAQSRHTKIIEIE